MDRDKFFNMFPGQDITVLYSIYNDILAASNSKQVICSKEFLTPNIWGAIINSSNNQDIHIKTYGAFEESERRVLIFNSTENFGINLIKIENKNKFLTLSHRDYLGGVLALGIKREKMGDFILKDNICYFPCKEEISDFLAENIKTIGNTKVSVKIIHNMSSDIISIEYEDKVIDVPSLRIDSIVSELIKASRSEGVNLIKKGMVLYNYAENLDKSKIVSKGSVITIRGYGKYKIEDEIGKTKKGNIKIYIKKYK